MKQVMYNKSFGFTLAEVLITLGIIGIVAAMTIPNLIANYQKKETTTKLQKIYSVLNNAMKLSQVENGDSTSWPDQSAMTLDNYVTAYWKPYFAHTQTCHTAAECGYSGGNNWLGAGGSSANINVDNFSTIKLNDGEIIFFERNGTWDGIYVDINGNSGPNKRGRDLFYFDINTAKGLVLPHGYELADISGWCSQTQNLTHTESGCMCAEKIRRDGWQIKDDYPW